MKSIDKEGVEWLVEMDILQPNLLTRTMKVETSEFIDNYQVGDVCMFKKSEEGHPSVFTTHKVDMDYGVVYYYKLDGIEESIGISYIKKINIKSLNKNNE